MPYVRGSINRNRFVETLKHHPLMKCFLCGIILMKNWDMQSCMDLCFIPFLWSRSHMQDPCPKNSWLFSPGKIFIFFDVHTCVKKICMHAKYMEEVVNVQVFLSISTDTSAHIHAHTLTPINAHTHTLSL